MDLFTTSDLPSSTSFDITSLLDSASSIGEAGSPGHHQNFIKFLQYATALQLNILPLAWEPAPEALGPNGATAKVNQSILNSEMTLVYKRFKSEVTDHRLSEAQFRELQYTAMINELIILARPEIGNRDGIVRFLGICFELSPNAVEVWPVLVLLKATRGDLATYMTQNESLEPARLLTLCCEIAKGVHRVHHYGVIHGDINPRNILVWHDVRNDGLEVVLADFGFSRFGATDDLVKLARSEPWDAPEWHPREFKLKDAKKMDVYSVGLVCLWLFFGNNTLFDLGLPSTTIKTAFMGGSRDAIARIQSRKNDNDSVLEWALELLAKKTDLDGEIRHRLERVFTLALARDPHRRPSSMGALIEILVDGSSEFTWGPDSPAVVTPPQWHGSLDAPILFHLDLCDYRVHRFFVKSLVQMAQDEGCDCCRQSAAFQLSLCHSIGFGALSSEEESNKWLHISERTANDFSEILDAIKNWKPKSNPLENLEKLGYRYDLMSRYKSEGIIDDAMEYYRHISLAREKALGPDHFSTLRLKQILITHLMNEGQYNEACKIALTMTRLDNISPSDRIAVNTILARLWAALGETEKAESVYRGLLEFFAVGRGPEDSERLDHQLDLVNLLSGRGEHEQALALALKTVEECLQQLGPSHSISRCAKRRLAAAYDAKGQLEKAIEVNEDLTKLKERVSTDEQFDAALVQDIARLGVQYYLLGRSDAALGCYKRVDNFVKRSIEMATPAVDAVNNCAIRLINCGELEKAATILERLLPESSTILGVQSKETAMVMGNLAYIYESKMQWDKVETLERQVLKTRRLVLGDTHPDTVIAMGNLRQTLLAQKRYVEAAEIAQQDLA